MNLESGVLQVHIEDIIPNRFQPRLTFDEQGLKELSDSIREHGIIQPLVLRKLGDKYEIIAGERRYKASQMAGLTTVPAVIANIDDNKSAEVALVENVQRRDLTAIEEARSYRSLLDKGYLTQDQLAKRMGLSQPAIANKLRLLNLDEEVQQALLEEKISERHARTLLTLQDKEAQKAWLHRIINERLTVRQLDLELKKAKELEDIPLVSSRPSIEDIKANAVDIGLASKMNNEPQNSPETLETLDIIPTPIPEALTFEDNTLNSQKGIESGNNPFMTATSIPEFNIATPNSASTFIPSESLTNNSSDSNKFFELNNYQNDNQNPSFLTSFENNNDTNKFEVFDSPTYDNSFITQNSPVIEEPVQNPTPPLSFDNQNLNSSFEINSNNRFFTPVNEPPMEISSLAPQEKEINPMDAVDNLTNDQSGLSKNGQLELKDAISSIRNCIENLGDKGFFIDVEEIDFENNYQITMRIHKDN